MSLFEKCTSLTIGKGPFPTTETKVSSTDDNHSTHLTVPGFIKYESITLAQRVVFYISDLHLVHHIFKQFPDGAADSDIQAFIHSTVLDLFNGEFGDAIRAFKSPVVMFGGDISFCFSISELFYQEFISIWENIVDEKNNLCCAELDPIRNELDEVTRQYSEWEEKNPWVQNAQKPIEEYSDKKIPRKIKEQYMHMRLLKEQISKKTIELGVDILWKSAYQRSRKHEFIYSVIGNHELWEFSSYDSCIEAYDRLFKKCGIRFMCDKINWLGPVLRLPYNILVVGGIGFAGMNDSFNANQGIYGSAVNRKEEVERCAAWRELYHEALTAAKKTHCSLVVFTHMPVSDWGGQSEKSSNCFFFSGHTHRNSAYRDENNNFFFADSQVGYFGKKFHFKKAILHLPRNPFANDPDGYREISCDEYKEYYLFVQDGIPGTGTIELQSKMYGAKLYVMKRDGYVGFFMVGPRGVYICNGGQIRKIGCLELLNRYYQNFKTVIDKYIAVLTPLRRAQEKLSSFIKRFGGSGRIHGTIVDIDFENHIMFNTVDGTMIPYNSPEFGIVITYADIGMLLHEQSPELEKRYLALGNGQMLSIAKEISENQARLEQIDIKNSPYVLSRKVNALQRLFDKRILRDWNSLFEGN